MAGWLTNVAAMGVATDADALLWKAAVVGLGGTVSDARLAQVSTFVAAMKAASLWTILDRLWLFAAENSTSALIDLVTRTAATATNSPTFTTDRGFTGNGTTSFVLTNYVASTQAVNYGLNSSALFGYFNTDRAAADSRAAYGTDNGTGVQTAMSLRLAAGTQDAYLNNTFAAGHANGTVGDTLGLATVSRTTSNLTTTYRRGASVGTTAAPSSAVPNVMMPFLCFNNNGVFANFETARGAAFGISSGLSGAQVTSVNSILEASYLTPIGASV